MAGDGGSDRGGRPAEGECSCDDHVGRLHHDEARDIWYECVYDKRRRVFTWTILPPAEEPPRRDPR